MHDINRETITELTSVFREDAEVLNIIYDALESFEEYHSVIYRMETWMKVYSYKSTDKEAYQFKVEEMDKRRTACHNAVLISVNVLNRLATQEGLPLVYDGVISEERPHRREVADAVLEYVEDIIKMRR